MLIKVKSKDFPKILLGIPANQWRMSTDDGDKLRFSLLVPQHGTKSPFCEVEIPGEEDSEWFVFGKDEKYTNRELKDDELLEVDEETNSDIYYVWDDGAVNHMERAKRLYDKYKDEIEAHAEKARKIRQEAADNAYQKDIAYAKQCGWELDSIPVPRIENDYGPIPFCAGIQPSNIEDL